MTAGGGPPSFKTRMNAQTALRGHTPLALFPTFTSAYHFTADLISVLPPADRQRWLVEEGETRLERLVPAAVEEQMLGGWHLAEAVSSRTLITALNCSLNMCLRVTLGLLRRRIYGQKELCLLEGGPFITNGCKLMDIDAAVLFLYLLGYHHCLAICDTESFL